MAYSFGHKSDHGMWDRMIETVIRGKADIGIGNFVMTKERSELVAYTNALGFSR